MLPEKWKNRATRCPICGGKACDWWERLSVLGRKCNCRTCGEGCSTPLWIYFVNLVVSIPCAILGFDLFIAKVQSNPYHRMPYWYIYSGILSYFLSGIILTWLVPLEPYSKKGRAFQGIAHITRILDYSPENVYAALSNALRRSDTYEVLQQDPEHYIISVYRDRSWYNCGRYDPPSVSITLQMEKRPDGRCNVTINAEYTKKCLIPESEKARELEELCQLAEQELESFHYPRISGIT